MAGRRTCLRCGLNTEGPRAKVICIGNEYIGTLCGNCIEPTSGHASEIREAIREIVGGPGW